jgi:hypothetical protein
LRCAVTTPIAPGTRIPLEPFQAIELAGRAGTVLNLVPDGEAQQYSWTPEVWLPASSHPHAPKKAILPTDYDVQVAWISATKPINNPPFVFWRCEYGHGECTYDLPVRFTGDPALPPPIPFVPQPGWVLPNRGLRLRIPSRSIRFLFSTLPEAEPPPEPAVPGGAPCAIQISVQPCTGLEPEQLPVTDMIFGGSAFPPAQLPLGATELRFADPNTGLSFAAATAFVQFYDFTGSPVGGPTDSSLYATWAPIPIFAAFWQPVNTIVPPTGAQTVQVSYR